MLPMVLLLASCSETIEEADLSPQRLRSVRDLRAVYDEKYVEWDSVEYFSYKVSEGGSTADLVSKKDGSVYSFSKYFRVGSAIKRNFYHENVEI